VCGAEKRKEGNEITTTYYMCWKGKARVAPPQFHIHSPDFIFPLTPFPSPSLLHGGETPRRCSLRRRFPGIGARIVSPPHRSQQAQVLRSQRLRFHLRPLQTRRSRQGLAAPPSSAPQWPPHPSPPNPQLLRRRLLFRRCFRSRRRQTLRTHPPLRRRFRCASRAAQKGERVGDSGGRD